MISPKLKIGAAIVGAIGTGVAVSTLAVFSSGISQSVESGGAQRFPAIRIDNGLTVGGSVTAGGSIVATGAMYGLPASSGGWAATFFGVAAEGANASGAFIPSAGNPGGKFGYVACTCRVAGTGGSDGIKIDLMEDGTGITSLALTGSDANACNDVAGTVLRANFNTTYAGGSLYTLQFNTATDCASNPTDCVCNTEVLR